jgi:DNA polymerase-3 subunit epsilon
MTDRRVIDAQRIFHKKEPRDLSAALRFYCDKEHTDAHGALPDVEATIDVLEGQFERYEDLPTNADQLDEFCNPSDPRYVDRTGRIAWNSNGEAAINFGKHSGHTLRELVLSEPGFLRWILKNDFPGDTQHIVRQALAGFYPQRGE